MVVTEPNPRSSGSFVALRAFYRNGLIDCLEFTGPLPMLEKEAEFPSTATEQKL